MKIGLSGGYFNHPLDEQLAYFQSMPEYLLYDGLLKLGHQVDTYGTEAYPFFKNNNLHHCHHLSRTLQWLGAIRHSPLIVTLHNPFIASGFKPKLNFLTRHALNEASYIIALSPKEKEYLIKDYGLSEKKIVVIPNGLKLELYDRPRELISRLKYKIPEGSKVILTVGQLLPFKNIPLLLEAFKIVQKTEKDVVLVVKTHNPKMLNQYEKVPNVHFITEKLKQKELTDLYYSCDLYVQPSNAEALCTCITEAMLCERPIIATDVGGTSTQILQCKTGILLPPDSQNLLYEALKVLLKDEEFRKTVGQNAKKYATEHFNQDSMIQSHIRLYEQV